MQSTKQHVSLQHAKDKARKLRIEAEKTSAPLSHSQALERVAKELGYRDWNTAAALLTNYPDMELQIGDHIRGKYMKQPFTGRVLSITEQVNNSHYQITIDLDEAVDVVTFDSFSNFRKRIRSQVDSKGDSQAKTSDGVPHLVIEGHVHP